MIRINLIKHSVLACGMIFMTAACHNEADKLTNNTDDISKLGIWEHRGYGDIYVFSDNGAKRLQLTQYACVLAETYSLEEANLEYLDSANVSDQGLRLSIQTEGSPFAMELERLEELPYLCRENKLLTSSSSPLEIYEYFWSIFHEYYAFFEERKVDWNEVYAEAQSELDDNMSDVALFSALQTSLKDFSDYHVSLQSEDLEFSPAPSKGVTKIFETLFDLQTEQEDYNEFSISLFSQISSIHQTRLDPDSTHVINGNFDYPPFGFERVVWGTLQQGDVGYLRINLMALDLDPDDPENTQKWIENAKKVMKDVMNSLSETQYLIIDMRFNGGGLDAVSMAIASCFNTVNQRVVGKYTKTIDGNSPIQWAELPASPNSLPYTKPVIILTSGSTVSAGEMFLVMMKALPHVQIMGEASFGALSDVLDKTLPNGWVVGLSNEVYVDTQLKTFETLGITPDIPMIPLDIQGIEEGRDTVLEDAIESFQNNKD